ncbi:hypothetical protein DM02DRAFT_657083 [Periconia macrospinosa]|uniref:Uncharacterized protein n=1 Tax=Periconia macrospinosa TaxID=97972 RepID=A0A2V1DN35_9PLEO|nr:hypothetical protein DM02DRAFT_657083 [Periconia macrospinosa]
MQLKLYFLTAALNLAAAASPLRPRQSNLQDFLGALGGISAPPVLSFNDPKRPFDAGGNTFVLLDEARERSCDLQLNQCADRANSSGGSAGFSVQDCNQQKVDCLAARF